MLIWVDGDGGGGGNGVMLGLFLVLSVLLEWVVNEWREVTEDGNRDSTTFSVWTEDMVTSSSGGLSFLYPQAARARAIFVRNLLSFLVQVVELIGGLGGLFVAGVETNCNVLGSDYKDILMLGELSLSLGGLL